MMGTPLRCARGGDWACERGRAQAAGGQEREHHKSRKAGVGLVKTAGSAPWHFPRVLSPLPGRRGPSSGGSETQSVLPAASSLLRQAFRGGGAGSSQRCSLEPRDATLVSAPVSPGPA